MNDETFSAQTFSCHSNSWLLAELTICGRLNTSRHHFLFVNVLFSLISILHLDFSRSKTECLPCVYWVHFKDVNIWLFPFLSSAKSEQHKRKWRKCKARDPGRPMARQIPQGVEWKSTSGPVQLQQQQTTASAAARSRDGGPEWIDLSLHYLETPFTLSHLATGYCAVCKMS